MIMKMGQNEIYEHPSPCSFYDRKSEGQGKSIPNFDKTMDLLGKTLDFQEKIAWTCACFIALTVI